MKKTFVLLVLASILGVSSAYAIDPFFVVGVLYDADGSSGNASSANSFAGASIFRAGVNNEIATLNSGVVFYAGQVSGQPAYINQDAGSQWTTSLAAGQTMA